MAQIILHPREGRTPKDYALMYIGIGWKVFPVWSISNDRPGEGGRSGTCCCRKGADCDRPGKHPIAELVPNGVTDATSDRAKVEAWWGSYITASIGVATGAGSGITVIDADVGNGKPGLINLTRIFASHGGVPNTFTVNTGGGGLHIYFKYSKDLRTGVNVLAEAIDVRNDGGYVIAPPSMHMIGEYKWRSDSAELMALPPWLLEQPAQPRTRGKTKELLPLDQVQEMLVHIDPADRDHWLKIGLVLGRTYVGTEAEAEAWAMYEAWSAQSDKFDLERAANITRMREQFYEASQLEPRAGSAAAGLGTIVYLARAGGWTPFGKRIVVKYEPGNESVMCSALVAALTVDESKNRFFNVMGEVREVLQAPISSLKMLNVAVKEGDKPTEYLMSRRASVPALQVALSECAALATASAQGIPKARPMDASLMLNILQGKSRDFPTLTGIAKWPMVLDGKILVRKRGYDSSTGMYFDIDPLLAIDESIGAEEGWNWIRTELLADFPFEDKVHAAGALAMMVAMMQRPLMRICPGFAVTAPQPGTGKSTLIEVASLSIYGSPSVSHAYSSSEEELRKALQSIMMAKIPMVLFDNIKRGASISSDHLAKTITSEMVSDRVLGSSEMSSVSNTVVITFTGNNISFVRDLSSRVITLRLNARSENPIGRSFRHPDIRAWAAERRSKLLSALIAIARQANGERPATGRASRFDDYDALVVMPVLKTTGIDVRDLVVMDDADAEEQSITRDALSILCAWQQTLRGEANGKRWKTGDVASAMDARAFSEQQLAAIKRFANNERGWESDPIRTLSYAFRAAKDDYNFAPFLLTSKYKENTAHWRISNREATETAVAGEAF